MNFIDEFFHFLMALDDRVIRRSRECLVSNLWVSIGVRLKSRKFEAVSLARNPNIGMYWNIKLRPINDRFQFESFNFLAEVHEDIARV